MWLTDSACFLFSDWGISASIAVNETARMCVEHSPAGRRFATTEHDWLPWIPVHPSLLKLVYVWTPKGRGCWWVLISTGWVLCLCSYFTTIYLVWGYVFKVWVQTAIIHLLFSTVHNCPNRKLLWLSKCSYVGFCWFVKNTTWHVEYESSTILNIFEIEFKSKC